MIALRRMGELDGDDDRVRRCDRESMVRWMQLEELAPGTRVRFEVEGTEGSTTVERVD